MLHIKVTAVYRTRDMAEAEMVEDKQSFLPSKRTGPNAPALTAGSGPVDCRKTPMCAQGGRLCREHPVGYLVASSKQ